MTLGNEVGLFYQSRARQESAKTECTTKDGSLKTSFITSIVKLSQQVRILQKYFASCKLNLATCLKQMSHERENRPTTADFYQPTKIGRFHGTHGRFRRGSSSSFLRTGCMNECHLNFKIISRHALRHIRPKHHFICIFKWNRKKTSRHSIRKRNGTIFKFSSNLLLFLSLSNFVHYGNRTTKCRIKRATVHSN